MAKLRYKAMFVQLQRPVLSSQPLPKHGTVSGSCLTSKTYLVWWVDQCQGSQPHSSCVHPTCSQGPVSHPGITSSMPCTWPHVSKDLLGSVGGGAGDAHWCPDLFALCLPEFSVLAGHQAGISESSHSRFWSSQIPVSCFMESRLLCSLCPFCGCHS